MFLQWRGLKGKMKIFNKEAEASIQAVIRAKRLIGSKVLAEKTGISRQNIYYWQSSNTFLPLDKAVKIWFATDGEVHLDELRPDLKVLIEKLIMFILKKYGRLADEIK